MDLYAKYTAIVDITEDVLNGEDVSDLLDEKEPTICYQCHKEINADIEAKYFEQKNESETQHFIAYTFFKFLGEVSDKNEKSLLIKDLDDTITLCMYCSPYEFELKKIVES